MGPVDRLMLFLERHLNPSLARRVNEMESHAEQRASVAADIAVDVARLTARVRALDREMTVRRGVP